MKIIKYYNLSNRNILILIILFFYENKTYYLIYNYTLDFINAIKINLFIIDIANK